MPFLITPLANRAYLFSLSPLFLENSIEILSKGVRHFPNRSRREPSHPFFFPLGGVGFFLLHKHEAVSLVFSPPFLGATVSVVFLFLSV